MSNLIKMATKDISEVGCVTEVGDLIWENDEINELGKPQRF